MKLIINGSSKNLDQNNSQREYEYRKDIYLKRKHEFETYGEEGNNDFLSREEKMNIAKAEMDKVDPKSVKGSSKISNQIERIKDAIFGDKGAIDELKKSGYKVNRLVNPLSADEVGKYVVISPNGQRYTYDNTCSEYSKSTSVKSSTDFQHRDVVKYNGHEYAIYYTDINTSPEADEDEMLKSFQFSISRLAAYDDADYAWAKGSNGIINYYRSEGKKIETTYYFTPTDMDVENDEWCDEVVGQAIQTLEELDNKTKPKMIHNSTKTSKDSERIMGHMENATWKEVASKQVPDSDGFMTDYTMYTDGVNYICMFGDKDIYEPDYNYSDFDTVNEDEAWEWFNNYNGFDEEDEYSDDDYPDPDYNGIFSSHSIDEISLKDFEFWDGGADTAKYLTDREFEILENAINELYPNGISKSDLNDLFWFEDDFIATLLGYDSFDEIIEERG